MLMRPRRRDRGFTLIELLTALAVLGVLIMIGLPGMTIWIQNSQVRTAAESVQAGLKLARAEALKRNTNVTFQLVDTLTATCALSTTGTNWIVSLASPVGACQVAPSEDTTTPQIIQKRSGEEGSRNAVLAATGGSSVTFNGLGRSAAGSLTEINVSNSTAACQATGPIRCLRVLVSAGGGQVRMCDPVADASDPRAC